MLVQRDWKGRVGDRTLAVGIWSRGDALIKPGPEWQTADGVIHDGHVLLNRGSRLSSVAARAARGRATCAGRPWWSRRQPDLDGGFAVAAAQTATDWDARSRSCAARGGSTGRGPAGCRLAACGCAARGACAAAHSGLAAGSPRPPVALVMPRCHHPWPRRPSLRRLWPRHPSLAGRS